MTGFYIALFYLSTKKAVYTTCLITHSCTFTLQKMYQDQRVVEYFAQGYFSMQSTNLPISSTVLPPEHSLQVIRSCSEEEGRQSTKLFTWINTLFRVNIIITYITVNKHMVTPLSSEKLMGYWDHPARQAGSCEVWTQKFMNAITGERGNIVFWNWYHRCCLNLRRVWIPDIGVRDQLFRFFKFIP